MLCGMHFQVSLAAVFPSLQIVQLNKVSCLSNLRLGVCIDSREQNLPLFTSPVTQASMIIPCIACIPLTGQGLYLTHREVPASKHNQIPSMGKVELGTTGKQKNKAERPCLFRGEY